MKPRLCGKGLSLHEDIRLARRIQQGDRRAFEEFLDSFGSRVHSLVRRYIENPSDAEDMTQDIFLDLYRSIGSFRGEAALSTWVYRVTVNHCLKYHRRAHPVNVPYDEEIQQVDSNWQGDPEAVISRSELSDQVQGALGQLTPLHRDVVILHELHGLTYQECAEILGIPVGTVKSRLSNAFRHLRSILGGYVAGEGTALHPGAVGETTL